MTQMATLWESPDSTTDGLELQGRVERARTQSHGQQGRAVVGDITPSVACELTRGPKMRLKLGLKTGT